MFFWLFSLLYMAALLGLLLVARYAPKWYTLAKGSCSALLVLGGVLAYWQGQRQAAGNFGLLLGALALCMAGDILLGLANKSSPFAVKPFLAGAASFAVAHILFCVLYSRFAPLAWYDFVLPVLLLLLVFVLEKSGRVHLGKMRAPGY
ncbi:MAG: lysoplasmalogenase family protein, partial [Oscillospiraceae bacterium]